MARRRMIEITTSHDKDLNSLPIFAELLYHRILPHTDDYGRFEGDPEVVRARVMPLRKKSLTAVEEAMRQIAAAGLWIWYKLPTGKMVVQYKTESFERINAFLIKNRGNSEFPPYKKEYELICGDMPPYHIVSNKHKAESKEQKDRKPPSFDEIRALWVERGYPELEAGKFFAHYSSNGWKVGRNPMVDWKAAAAGWVMRSKEYSSSSSRNTPDPAPRRRSTWTCPKCGTEDHAQGHQCPEGPVANMVSGLTAARKMQ